MTKDQDGQSEYEWFGTIEYFWYDLAFHGTQ
jgi:hypothetical protein